MLDDVPHRSIHLLLASLRSMRANQSSRERWYRRLIGEDATHERPGHRDREGAVRGGLGLDSGGGWVRLHPLLVGARADQARLPSVSVDTRRGLLPVDRQCGYGTSDSEAGAILPIERSGLFGLLAETQAT